MAKRLQFCTALLLSMSVFATGCTVDVQDPNEQGSTTDPSTTNTAPVIELKGEPVLTIPVNAAFVEPGVLAMDAEDGDITSAVYSNSMQVDTGKPGKYEIIYRVTDSASKAAEPVKRIVIVTDPVVGPEEPSVEPGEPEVLVPSIEGIKLVGFTSDKDLVELKTLVSGSVIDLSQTSIDLLNIVADSADVSNTGSVHFKLDGPVSIDRWENNAIYTMAVDTVNLSIAKSQFPVGDYALTVTPYALPDMEGQKGAVKTISFKVVDNQIVTSVPKIAAVELVSVTEGTGDYVVVTRITEGAEINLADLATRHVNVIAVSEDVSKTGSVHFSLVGPTEIDRAENVAAYALANETQHLDLSKNELPVGDYALVVTPYAGVDATGEAGIPLLINFAVVGEVSAPEHPAVESPAPIAKSDSYTFYAGSDAQPGQVQPVSANDEFNGDAVYSVTKAPSHGSIDMFDMGYFTYTPDAGFSGSDSFTYQVAQAGKTSSASVVINVAAANTGDAGGSSEGFTVIKPSPDSKLIYVSSSTGSDANTCLSEAAPCKTISAGLEKMRNGYPDHLYLKRGDVWRDQRLINLHSGRSAKEPAVMAYYGNTGPRPKIANSNTAMHIFKGTKMTNFSFIGLEFYAYNLDPKSPDFTGSGSANLMLLGGNENLLFEDNKFTYTEIVFQVWEGAAPTNITLRRNIWNGAYYNQSSFERNKRPSNIYADGVVGLTIEENVFDHGGWNATVPGAGANMYNHNLYIQSTTDGSKLVLRNNIITRGSSHGVQLRSGGIAEDNFLARNAVGLLIGFDAKKGTRAHAIRNVISEGGSMVKGDKACSGVNLCSRAIWGLHMEANDVADYQATGNVVSSRMANDNIWSNTFSSLSVVGLNGLSDSRIKSSDNIEWGWSSAPPKSSAYSQPGRTLGDYNQFLGGANSFEDFMQIVLNRPVGQWDEKYSASAINSYIRAGYDMK